MYQDNIYIHGSCVISAAGLLKDGNVLLENKGLQVADFLQAIYLHFGIKYPKFYKMDNLSKLGWLTAEFLLEDFQKEGYAPEDIGVILANANASLDTDIKYFETTRSIPSPALFVYTLPNIMTGEICIRHHFQGENAFFIMDRFDADFMRQYVSNLINNNTLQACICGWVELLGDSYRSALMLVAAGSDKKTGSNPQPFTMENIFKIYQSENG